MLCRQCGSLWESLSGRRTTVPMTISQLGTFQSLQISSSPLFLHSPYNLPLFSLALAWCDRGMVSERSTSTRLSTEVGTKPSKLVDGVYSVRQRVSLLYVSTYHTKSYRIRCVWLAFAMYSYQHRSCITCVVSLHHYPLENLSWNFFAWRWCLYWIIMIQCQQRCNENRCMFV